MLRWREPVATKARAGDLSQRKHKMQTAKGGIENEAAYPQS